MRQLATCERGPPALIVPSDAAKIARIAIRLSQATSIRSLQREAAEQCAAAAAPLTARVLRIHRVPRRRGSRARHRIKASALARVDGGRISPARGVVRRARGLRMWARFSCWARPGEERTRARRPQPMCEASESTGAGCLGPRLCTCDTQERAAHPPHLLIHKRGWRTPVFSFFGPDRISAGQCSSRPPR